MAVTAPQTKADQLKWFAEAFAEAYPVDKAAVADDTHAVLRLYGCELVLLADGTWFMDDTSGG